MSIYEIDFATQAKIFTRPKYRLPKILSFLKNLVSPLDWLRLNRLYRYKYGYYDVPRYNKLTYYNRYDLVIWTDGAVYMRFTQMDESYPDGQQPYDGYAEGSEPPLKFWIKVADSFVGSDERQFYTSQLLSLEYRFNRWFGTLVPSQYPGGFWPANYPDKDSFDANRPKIYIGNEKTDPDVFYAGIDESESSMVGLDNESFLGKDFVGIDTETVGTKYAMTINYPLALIPVVASGQTFEELSSTDSRLRQLESLVNKSKHVSLAHAYKSY
jgi:hypothetical protein